MFFTNRTFEICSSEKLGKAFQRTIYANCVFFVIILADFSEEKRKIGRGFHMFPC